MADVSTSGLHRRSVDVAETVSGAKERCGAGQTLWLVIPIARELLPDLLEGVPAASVRLQKLDDSPRAYDLIVTAPEQTEKWADDA